MSTEDDNFNFQFIFMDFHERTELEIEMGCSSFCEIPIMNI